MVRPVILAILFLAGSCYSKRIVGGQDVTIEQYPSVVQVEYYANNEWGQRCAANVLNNLFVLSAAHCFFPAWNLPYQRHTTRIRAGATFRNSGGVITPIIREFNHPNYLNVPGVRFEADITVVRLANPLVFSNIIKPVQIPPQNSVIADGLSVVHAGWGQLWTNGPMSPVLQDVQVYTVNNTLCRERYLSLQWPFSPQEVTPTMICAGVLEVGGRDACGGDSGGPLFYQNWTIGVVSFGHECATSTHPGVSTNVASFTNWIVEIAESDLF